MIPSSLSSDRRPLGEATLLTGDGASLGPPARAQAARRERVFWADGNASRETSWISDFERRA